MRVEIISVQIDYRIELMAWLDTHYITYDVLGGASIRMYHIDETVLDIRKNTLKVIFGEIYDSVELDIDLALVCDIRTIRPPRVC